jgi:hypothetical protein
MRIRHILSYMGRPWTTDVGLSTLLVSLLIYIFFLTPLGGPSWVRFLTNVCFSLVLVTGAITVSRSRILRILVFSWGFLTFTFLWIRYLFPHQNLVFINTCLALIFLGLLTFLILGQTLREGPTTSHRIMGAVAAYLILGVIWFLAYYLIAIRVPEAFSFQGSSSLIDAEALRSHLFYFSFVTLTTLGYGDIVPVHPMVRMLVIMEGVTGQLFPAILIARLVSLQVQSKQKT